MVSTDTLALSDALATIRTLSVELATARQERDDAIAAMNLATARRSACVCVYTAPLGQSIMDAVHEMHSIAKASGDVVTCRFNDINIAVRPAGRGNDCDGEAVQDDLWAKVRATLESGGFNFDELVERARKNRAFSGFAMRRRDAIGILANTHQAQAEMRLGIVARGHPRRDP